MDDSTLPPTYSRFSLPVAYERVPVPTYTELAHTSERVLHSAPASPVASHDTLGPAYVYHTDHLEINLGRCPWGLQYAAYGRGGLINGSVRFTKKCSHVVKLTVTVNTPTSYMYHLRISDDCNLLPFCLVAWFHYHQSGGAASYGPSTGNSKQGRVQDDYSPRGCIQEVRIHTS